MLGGEGAKSVSITLSNPSRLSDPSDIITAFLICYDGKLTVDSVYDRFQSYLQLNEFDFRLTDNEMIIETAKHN